MAKSDRGRFTEEPVWVNSHKALRVQLRSYNGGAPMVDVRVWERDRQTGNLFPTSQGVRFHSAQIDGLVVALDEIEEAAIDAGLIPKLEAVAHD